MPTLAQKNVENLPLIQGGVDPDEAVTTTAAPAPAYDQNNPDTWTDAQKNQFTSTLQATGAIPIPPTAPADPSTPPGYTTGGYEAERVQMEDTESVESRVSDIIKADSPLMQQAKTGAAQAANAKGLLNSSMAAGAAQNAVIGAALPIAQQDAKTAADLKLANQQAGNEADKFTAGEKNTTANIFNNGIMDMSKISQQGLIDLQKINANIEGDFKLLNAKGEIDLNMQQDAQAATSALQAEKGEIDKMLIGADAYTKSLLASQQATIALEQSKIDAKHAQDLQLAKGYIDALLQNASAEDALILAKVNGEIDVRLENIKANNEIAVTQLRAESDIEVAQINNEYNVLIQNNTNAANASRVHQEAVINIWGQEHLTVAQRNDLVQKANDDYTDTLEMISLTGDTDYTQTLG